MNSFDQKASSRSFLRNQSGQGTVEYILLLSVTILLVTQLTRRMVKTLDNGVLVIGGQLEKDLKTGRLTLSGWKN